MGFRALRLQQLQHTSLAVVALGLSYSEACGIFLDQGWNPCLLHWQTDSLPLSHQGSPMIDFLSLLKLFLSPDHRCLFLHSFFFFLAEDWVQSLGWENPLEKEMANHSSVLAWKVPWTEEPGGLQSLWSHRVGHN